MDLLEKFSAVEVQADNRISEHDKFYCEQQQSAYETAINNFGELSFVWADMKKAQEELLGEPGTPFFHDYLTSRNGPSISQDSIEQHIEALHTIFIGIITSYFNSTYSVSASSEKIAETLIPQKPEHPHRYDDEALENYRKEMDCFHKRMQKLVIRYQDVVDQIILQLDGRSFSEQAFYELSQKCHRAAWNTYRSEPEFEQKKDTIRFTGYFCRLKGWPYDGWELQDSMKSILYGAAHYETGSYQIIPLGFSELLHHYEIKSDTVEFSTCEKLVRLKMFKNGRVDLKFASVSCAEEFLSKYLGTVC